MDSNQWDKLKNDKARAKKLMQQAGVPEILLQLRWGSLSKTQRKKIEQAAKGKGWFEEKEEVVTSKGTENKAPKHRKAALKAERKGAINEPIRTESGALNKRMGRRDKKVQPDAPTKIGTTKEYVLLAHRIDGARVMSTTVSTTDKNYTDYYRLSLLKDNKQIDGMDFPVKDDIFAQKEIEDRIEQIIKRNNLIPRLVEVKREFWNKKPKPIEKKEPPIISDPQRKTYDPAFEKSEDERMKEEKERELDIGIIEAEQTIGATGHDPITGEHDPDRNEYSQSPEEEEFSDLLAEAILIGAITSIEEKYEWQRLFNHNYPQNTESATKKLQELIGAHEKKQKPKGKRASEELITLYPEEHYFGTEVTVVTEEGVVDYTGKILRLLNGGTLAEVRPSGNSFKGSSFRVPIEQVYVNKIVENPKEHSNAVPELKTSPKIAISKTDSHSVYLVGDIKERSFVALANIVVTEDGRILELPGMDYMKGRDYPNENFNFTTVKEYLIDLKAKKEEVKRKQQEEKEAYEKKEAEIKERLSKPPSGYFIHKQDEQGDPLLEPVTEKVYPFEYQGIDLFAFKDTKGWNKRTSWNISERRTGLFVAGGRTKAETIQKAKELIDKKGAGEIKRQIKVALSKMGRTK